MLDRDQDAKKKRRWIKSCYANKRAKENSDFTRKHTILIIWHYLLMMYSGFVKYKYSALKKVVENHYGVDIQVVVTSLNISVLYTPQE